MVIIEEYSIIKASRYFGINLNTAKSIIKRFTDEGRIDYKTRDMKRNIE